MVDLSSKAFLKIIMKQNQIKEREMEHDLVKGPQY